jgi:GT2 family glycosyltransferase
MSKPRKFVLHRNDEQIPPDRTVEVKEIAFRHLQNHPKISVIIPTLDGHRDGLFPALLEQLSEQTFQDFETIVIKGDPWQGRAINTAVDISRGKYILTLDDDTSLTSKNAFEKLFEVMESNETIGMAGGLNVVPSNASHFTRRAMREISRRSTPKVEQVTDSDLAEHPLLIIRKEVFKMLGGENELLPRGLDPYLRELFRQAGYRVVVVPGVLYSHLPPSTLRRLIKQFYRNGRQAAFVNRNYPQWVIETPAVHGPFRTRVPLPFRILRFPIRLLLALITLKPIRFLSGMAYALGFLHELFFPKKFLE